MTPGEIGTYELEIRLTYPSGEYSKFYRKFEGSPRMLDADQMQWLADQISQGVLCAYDCGHCTGDDSDA